MKYGQQIEYILEEWLDQQNGSMQVVNFLVEWLLSDQYFTMINMTENNKQKLIEMAQENNK